MIFTADANTISRKAKMVVGRGLVKQSCASLTVLPGGENRILRKESYGGMFRSDNLSIASYDCRGMAVWKVK